MWCDHCDLPRAQCFHSVDRATQEAFDQPQFRSPVQQLVADGPTIDASTTSPCPACGDSIIVGESITHTDEGWAHTDEVLPASALDNTVDFTGF